MGTTIRLGSAPGGRDGYGHDLPLERELESPIVVDAASLRACHPMFLVRLRLFLDWHLAVGHEVRLIGPALPAAAGHLADMGVGLGLPEGAASGLPEHRSDAPVLSIRRLMVDADADDVAQQAVEVLHQQTGAIAGWGNALHMGISELCDNALHHGSNDLGAYIAADRVVEPRREFRLVIADLGIGIPEHIRARHPEWQDDAAAIAQVLNRGVTGTDDPDRGKGFSKTIDYALEQQLVQTSSARGDRHPGGIGSGRRPFGGRRHAGERWPGDGSPKSTWISYTVVTA